MSRPDAFAATRLGRSPGFADVIETGLFAAKIMDEGEGEVTALTGRRARTHVPSNSEKGYEMVKGQGHGGEERGAEWWVGWTQALQQKAKTKCEVGGLRWRREGKGGARRGGRGSCGTRYGDRARKP